MIENIVFSGAGIKLYSFLGFIRILEEKDILSNIKAFIGTSSGSLISLLCSLNFKYKEIEEILMKINTKNLKNITSENIISFFDNYGLDDGKHLQRILTIVLKLKTNNENISFKELYEITNKKLIITTTCVNNMETKFFNYKDTPDVSVLKAIMMSISVPLLFKPIALNDKLYVDGGLTNHYPIDFFKNEKNKTFGVLIYSDINMDIEINSIDQYIYNIFCCSFLKLVKNCYSDYKNNTVLIENNTNFLNFDIDYNSKLDMINDSYNKTKNFMETEEFKKYYNIDL